MKTTKCTTSTHVERESDSSLGTLFHTELQDTEDGIKSLMSWKMVSRFTLDNR